MRYRGDGLYGHLDPAQHALGGRIHRTPNPMSADSESSNLPNPLAMDEEEAPSLGSGGKNGTESGGWNATSSDSLTDYISGSESDISSASDSDTNELEGVDALDDFLGQESERSEPESDPEFAEGSNLQVESEDSETDGADLHFPNMTRQPG